MPTVQEVMTELQSMGDEKLKKMLSKHGIREPFFGVKIEYLKKLQKKIKVDYPLAKELYATGNADAMYLAGLITDDNQMTKADLQDWVEQATSSNINEFTVPWVASQGKFGYDLALEWISSANPQIAAAGWATLNCHITLTPDEQLDLTYLKKLLDKLPSTIHTADNRVKLKMNSFVIAVGTYVKPLTEEAIAAARKIGLVKADMNGTACKVADAVTYIKKAKDKGLIGRKKTTVKC